MTSIFKIQEDENNESVKKLYDKNINTIRWKSGTYITLFKLNQPLKDVA